MWRNRRAAEVRTEVCFTSALLLLLIAFTAAWEYFLNVVILELFFSPKDTYNIVGNNKQYTSYLGFVVFCCCFLIRGGVLYFWKITQYSLFSISDSGHLDTWP